MAKLTLQDITTGTSSFNAIVTAFNANNTAIETALENTLSRDGTAPNYMDAVLDMNGYRVINGAYPISDTDLATKEYVDYIGSGGLITTGIPEAPIDSIQYGRQNAAWTPIDVLEAPNDGQEYVRKSEAWAVATGGGGASFAITAAETGAGFIEADLDLAYPVGDARRYQLNGDGTTEDGTIFAKMLAANAGLSIYLEPGKTYKLSTAQTIATGTKIFAHGVIFTINHNNKAFTISGGSVEIHGGRYNGPTSAYLDGSICFYIYGTLNGAGVAPTRLTYCTLKDVWITNFGDTAIDTGYTSTVKIIRPRITSCGYAGIMAVSAYRTFVYEPFIETLVGETGSGQLNAYGIAFTSVIDSDLTRYPVSSDCEVDGGYIANIPTWHGADTHGGSTIRFKNITLYNCRRGIVLTNVTYAASTYCTIENCYYYNALTGTNSNGTEQRSEAFWDIGYSASVRATGNQIINNTIINGGATLAVGGAVFVEYSSGCTIAGNVFKQCWNEAVYVGTRVEFLSVDNNTITNTRGLGTGAGGPSNVVHGVLFNADYFENCKVTNNTFQVTDTTLASYMMNSGVTIGNYSNHSVHIDNNVYAGVATQVAMAGANSWSNLTGSWAGYISTSDALLLTWGLSVDVYVNCLYAKNGEDVTLRFGDTTGTSINASYVVTSLPSFLRPANVQIALCKCVDNTGTYPGQVQIGTNGILTYGVHQGTGAGHDFTDGLSNFTTSGSKGVTTCAFSYTTRGV